MIADKSPKIWLITEITATPAPVKEYTILQGAEYKHEVKIE